MFCADCMRCARTTVKLCDAHPIAASYVLMTVLTGTVSAPYYMPGAARHSMAREWVADLELQPCAVDELPRHLDGGAVSHRRPPRPRSGAPKEGSRASAPVSSEGFRALLQLVQLLREAQHLLKGVALQPLQRIDVLPAERPQLSAKLLHLCSVQQNVPVNAKVSCGIAQPKNCCATSNEPHFYPQPQLLQKLQHAYLSLWTALSFLL